MRIFANVIYNFCCDTSSKSYSFTRCVASYVTRRVGCRLELDGLSPEEYPICTTLREILELKDEYEKTWDMKQSRLVDHTGCFPPCNYAEYQLATEPMKYKEKEEITRNGSKRLAVLFSSSKALERKEQLLYSAVSLISEFGGALGLFLGFSFLMVWEALETCVRFSLRKIKFEE